MSLVPLTFAQSTWALAPNPNYLILSTRMTPPSSREKMLTLPPIHRPQVWGMLAKTLSSSSTSTRLSLYFSLIQFPLMPPCLYLLSPSTPYPWSLAAYWIFSLGHTDSPNRTGGVKGTCPYQLSTWLWVKTNAPPILEPSIVGIESDVLGSRFGF